MANKKRTKLSAEKFIAQTEIILGFLNDVSEKKLGKKDISWCHDYAVIRLYLEFEKFMLQAIVGAINNDTESVSEKLGFKVPKNINYDMCEYLVVGSDYFDFKGRSGLIELLSKYFPDGKQNGTNKKYDHNKAHYLVRIVKEKKYESALDQLSALRNFAAHGSSKAKKGALKAIRQEKISTSGTWLKTQGRFKEMVQSLRGLAQDIKKAAPR